MAEEVRQVQHYSTSIANKVGEGARALRRAGVNVIAFWGYPYVAGRARVEFIPENGAAFVAAAKQAKLKLRKKSAAFYIHGDDRPGAVADALVKRADQCGRSAGGLRRSRTIRRHCLPIASRCAQGSGRARRRVLSHQSGD